MSSSNTFGTFLETINNLEEKSPNKIDSSSASQARTASKEIMNILHNLSKSETGTRVKDLIADTNIPKGDLLSAMMEGQRHGLLEVNDVEDEAVAHLTQLGKAFTE